MVAATVAVTAGAFVLLRQKRAEGELAVASGVATPAAVDVEPAPPSDLPLAAIAAHQPTVDPAAVDPASAASAASIETVPHAEAPERVTVPPLAPRADPPSQGAAQPSTGRTTTGNVVRITVSNARPGLVAKLDGRVVALPLRLPKDMQPHEVTFETPNFRPEKHSIRADRDQTLTLDNKPSFYVP
jgi:hypothetical protein